jgi:hypothetical protein
VKKINKKILAGYLILRPQPWLILGLFFINWITHVKTSLGGSNLAFERAHFTGLVKIITMKI